MRRRAAVWSCGLAAALSLGLSGCVGYITSRFVWGQTASELKTKSEVLARFGEPLRKTREADREVWYYLVKDASAQPGVQAANVVFLVILPISWVAQPDENMKFIFGGHEAVSQAAKITGTDERGFLCGIFLIHGDATMCGRYPRSP